MKGLACVTVDHDFQPVRHFEPSHVTVLHPNWKKKYDYSYERKSTLVPVYVHCFSFSFKPERIVIQR